MEKKSNKIKGIPKLKMPIMPEQKIVITMHIDFNRRRLSKNFAMAGRSVIGRDKYGVFPLKGKFLMLEILKMVKRLWKI